MLYCIRLGFYNQILENWDNVKRNAIQLIGAHICKPNHQTNIALSGHFKQNFAPDNDFLIIQEKGDAVYLYGNQEYQFRFEKGDYYSFTCDKNHTEILTRIK